MIKNAWIFGAIAAIAISLYFIGLDQYLSLSHLKSYQAEYAAYYHANPTISLIVYSALFILLTVISIPATAILTVAAGALFGFVPGVLISLFSAVTGAVLAFLLARHVLGEKLQRKYCDQLKIVNDGIDKEGAFYLFSLRVMPILPFCMINFLMGLTRMKLVQYATITSIGIIFWVCIYVYAGTTLRKIKEIGDIISWDVVVALILLGMFPWIMKRVMPMISAKKQHRRQIS